MNIIICRDKTGDTTTSSDPLDIGENVIDVADASGLTAGDFIFITESDNSELESLGTLTSKNGNTITCQFGPAVAKDDGAKIWAADNIVDLGAGAIRLWFETDLGIRARSPVGSAVNVNKIADTKTFIRFRIPLGLLTLRTEVLAFLEDVVLGYKDFTLVTEDRTMYKVKQMNSLMRSQRFKLIYAIGIDFVLNVNATGDDAFAS